MKLETINKEKGIMVLFPQDIHSTVQKPMVDNDLTPYELEDSTEERIHRVSYFLKEIQCTKVYTQLMEPIFEGKELSELHIYTYNHQTDKNPFLTTLAYMSAIAHLVLESYVNGELMDMDGESIDIWEALDLGGDDSADYAGSYMDSMVQFLLLAAGIPNEDLQIHFDNLFPGLRTLDHTQYKISLSDIISYPE